MGLLSLSLHLYLPFRAQDYEGCQVRRESLLSREIPRNPEAEAVVSAVDLAGVIAYRAHVPAYHVHAHVRAQEGEEQVVHRSSAGWA
jgi:hypothetical protein